jgi:hypothetical protein
MHQCLIQWDGDKAEVVHADDSIEISHADMSISDAEDQELISGISLEGCDRVEATKIKVRLVLSTSLTESTKHKGRAVLTYLARPIPAIGPKK